MAKVVSTQSQIGESGIALIHQRTVEMGFVWRPTTTQDAGIDGQIEMRDPTTGVVAGLLIGVQSKATDRAFANETETGFTFACKAEDIAYWMSGNLPVILICSRPRTKEAYWISIKGFFSDPVKRSSGRLVFDKRTDRFDETARQRLFAVAAPPGTGLHLSAPRIEEQLWSNLMPVRYPESIYVARTSIWEPGQMHRALAAQGEPHPCEWVLTNKSILSIHPLDEGPWRSLCEQGTVECFAMDEWALADDERQWDFVALMKALLAQKVRKDLDWSRTKECFYFRAAAPGTPGAPDRELVYPSLHKNSSRDVVMSKRTVHHPDRIACVRHSAFAYQFIRLSTRWYLAVEPTYYFTKDGRFLHDNHEKWLAGAFRLEKNQGVLGQLVMWSWYLRQEGDLFNPPYPYLSFGPLETVRCDAGFDEASWFDIMDQDESEADALEFSEGPASDGDDHQQQRLLP